MSRTGQAAASKKSNHPGRRRIVAAAVAAAFPLVAWSQAQQFERVEITGSAIKRTDAEGPAPVEIITRKDIAKTGATSINELVRSIPSIDVFDQGELTSNSPAGSGTAQRRDCAVSARPTCWCCSTAAGCRSTRSTTRRAQARRSTST